MEILVNDEKLDFTNFDTTLEEFVNALTTDLLALDHVVFRMTLDGQEVTDEFRDAHGSRALSDFEKLEVISSDKYELSIRILQSIREHIPALSDALTDVALKLQQDRAAEAKALLADCLEKWRILTVPVQQVGTLLAINLEEVEFGDDKAMKFFISFGEAALSVSRSLTSDDDVNLSDIVEYELLPLVERYSGLADRLREIVLEKEKERTCRRDAGAGARSAADE